MYKKYIKRICDIVLSLIGIIMLSWLYILIAIAVKINSQGPVLFKQKRISRGKRDFYILKYRTMRCDAPKDMPTHLLHNPGEYITWTGRILRKYSLDELPQLFNIIKGDMSIIGPRPALWNQYDLIEERDKYGANDIRPGLTGLAQINGRDELPVDIKAKFDGEYVEKMSFLFDMQIFFGTVLRVLKHDGVVEGDMKITEKELAKK